MTFSVQKGQKVQSGIKQAIKSLHAGKDRKIQKPITGAESKSTFLKSTLYPNIRQTAGKKSPEHHKKQKGGLRCTVLLYSLPSTKYNIKSYCLIMEHNSGSG